MQGGSANKTPDSQSHKQRKGLFHRMGRVLFHCSVFCKSYSAGAQTIRAVALVYPTSVEHTGRLLEQSKVLCLGASKKELQVFQHFSRPEKKILGKHEVCRGRFVIRRVKIFLSNKKQFLRAGSKIGRKPDQRNQRLHESGSLSGPLACSQNPESASHTRSNAGRFCSVVQFCEPEVYSGSDPLTSGTSLHVMGLSSVSRDVPVM